VSFFGAALGAFTLDDPIDSLFAGTRADQPCDLRPDLLIIDDMGMKQLPKRSGENLFEIIMRRHQTRSTVMTSNRPLEDWGKLLGDVPSASAILDRFLHHGEVAAHQAAGPEQAEPRRPDGIPDEPRRNEAAGTASGDPGAVAKPIAHPAATGSQVCNLRRKPAQVTNLCYEMQK